MQSASRQGIPKSLDEVWHRAEAQLGRELPAKLRSAPNLSDYAAELVGINRWTEESPGFIRAVSEMLRWFEDEKDETARLVVEQSRELRSVDRADTRTRSTRAALVSERWAVWATWDHEVRSFRRNAIGGGLIDPAQADEWVHNHITAESWNYITESPEGEQNPLPPALLQALREHTPSPDEVRGPSSALSDPGDLRWRLADGRVLLVYTADNPVTAAIEGHNPSRPTSPLCRLANVAHGLATTFPWHTADTARFVITGEVPPLIPLRGTVQGPLGDLGPGSKVVLEVDPETVTPQDIVREYQLLRRLARGRSERKRQLDSKTEELALFAWQHQRELWRVQMEEWNRAHTAQRYERMEDFERAARRALIHFGLWSFVGGKGRRKGIRRRSDEGEQS